MGGGGGGAGVNVGSEGGGGKLKQTSKLSSGPQLIPSPTARSNPGEVQ